MDYPGQTDDFIQEETNMTGKNILVRHFSELVVKSQYAKVAWFYDAWSRITEEKALNKLLTLAEIKDGTAILEVGMGTGRLFERMVKLNPSGKNDGMDLSPEMLNHARNRLEKSVPAGNFDIREGTAYQLAYPSEHFDLLANTFMLDLLPVDDYPKILGEFLRVLKPGGKLALAYFSAGEHWYNRTWPLVAKYFPDLLTGCRPVDPVSALKAEGFQILAKENISQNTFPSAIVLALKPVE